LSSPSLAFVFPAFTSDYRNHPAGGVPGFENRFTHFIKIAAEIADSRLSTFHFLDHPLLDNELLTQYVTYAYSCALSSLLRDAGHSPSLSAGYSMGIYAALCDAGSISFETGLHLVASAYQAIEQALGPRDFGMGAVIGLDRSDIQHLIDRHGLAAEITNQNAGHAYVVSGRGEAVTRLLELATCEGALHTRNLQVTVPYHSVHLQPAATLFSKTVAELDIRPPSTPLLSLIDQGELTGPGEIRREVLRNLYQPLNWSLAMKRILDQGISGFVECGPSEGLSRNARFVEGVIFFPPASLLS